MVSMRSVHWLALVPLLAFSATGITQTPGEAARQFDPNIQRERTRSEERRGGKECT